MTLRIERVGAPSRQTIRDLQFWVGPWVARLHWRGADEDGMRNYTLFPNGRPHWSGWHRSNGNRYVPSPGVIPCGMDRMSYIMLKGAKDYEERKARLSEAARALAWEDYDRAEPLYWYPRPWSSKT